MKFEWTEDQLDALSALKVHAQMFLNSGLWSNSAAYPETFAGKDAENYRRWAKQAYDLIQKFPQE